MDIRTLKLSVVFIILIFTFSYCGGGTGGDAQKASIKLFLEFPEELFSDSSTELSGEPVLRQNGLEGTVTIEIDVGNFHDEETFDVSDLPIQRTFLVPAKPDVSFICKFITADGLLGAAGSTIADIVFGAENNVFCQLGVLTCLACDNPLCEGERCDPDDEAKICVDGECVTPTPPPTPTPTPTPIPTPTPTPRPIFGCCDLGLACENITNVECAEMQGLFLPGGFCISGGCRTTPPTPTPPPFQVCCEFSEDCAEITNVECAMLGGEPFFPASCYSCDGSCFPICD